MLSHKLFMNFRRMRHIKRCNNFPTLIPTDVAQHSYFTTMLAMLFVDELEFETGFSDIKPKPVNAEILLRKCMLHDLEEAFTSDIPYPVKHMSEEVHRYLENGINDKYATLIEKDGKNFVMSRWNYNRHNCKDGVEGSIVAFCDMLELALYCYEELCRGNKSLEVLLDNCNEYLDELLCNVFMNLYDVDLNYFKNTDKISAVVPSIWELRQIVSRDEASGEYNLQDFTVDIS